MRFPFALVSLASAISALPHTSHRHDHKRQSDGQTCAQYGKFQTKSYTLYNNLWGKDAGSGAQCTTLHSVSTSTDGTKRPGDKQPSNEFVAWSSHWSWSSSPDNVKSYANVVLQEPGTKTVSEYTSIPAYWEFTYTGSQMSSDVAFDIFTTTNPNVSSSPKYEIMVWLGKYGPAAPISSTGTTIASNLSLAGKVFDLYSGMNGQMKVYSFVMHGAERSSCKFHGDLMDLMRYLIKNGLIEDTQYLKQIGAGTETFTGDDCTFTTTKYSISTS